MGVKMTSKIVTAYTPRICGFWKLSQLFPIVPNRSELFPIVPNRSESFRIVPFRSVSFHNVVPWTGAIPTDSPFGLIYRLGDRLVGR